MTKATHAFRINGYEVSATFSNAKNEMVCKHIKQTLLSSFANNVPKRCGGDNLVPPQKQMYNRDSDSRYVP